VIDVSLIDMSQFDRMMLEPASADHTADHTGGRDAACAGVEAELRGRGPRPGATDVALRSYGDGRVAVGIAGPVDNVTARRFGSLLRGLRPFSTGELLVTLALLGSWDPQLARVIGQARVHHLIDGGRLDLRGAPPEMFAVIGAPPPAVVEEHPVPADPHPESCLEQWGLRA
jgi:hypothetical protein